MASEMSITVLCILQARMSSVRLPGKVLRPILGRPMLAWQIERIQRATGIDALCVATSTESADTAIAEQCATIGVDCYRGSLNDVLDRYYQAAQRYEAGHVMRLTADCPLVEPSVLDLIVDKHLGDGNDYTSNVHERSYPDGLDAELFTTAALQRAWRQAQSPFEREHVTPYLYRTGPPLKRGVVKDEADRSRLRWTVDYPEDFEFVSRVFEALVPTKPDFDMHDVLALLSRRPDLTLINAMRT
jgi:spore coat polysaccharide biosynthesis protein SpsF